MHGEFTHWIFIAETAIVLHYFLLFPSSSLNNVLSNDKGKQMFCTQLVMDKLEGVKEAAARIIISGVLSSV